MMTANEYLDLVMKRNSMKYDAALARALHLQPPHISKIRNGHNPFTLLLMMRLHECLGCNVAEMRGLIYADEFGIEARAPGVERVMAPAESVEA